MTFEERCKKFEDNSENEINLFKRVCRAIFLAKKKEEQIQLENQLFAKELQKEEQEKQTRKRK